MVDFKDALIDEDSSIGDAIRVIDKNSFQIALVVDKNLRLLGTVTDGDIRRAILKGLGIDSQVSRVMNSKPTTASPDWSRAQLVSLMKKKGLRHVPLVDSNGVVCGIELLVDTPTSEDIDTLVVIMAGGLGKRLGDLTTQVPKPMLEVRNKPILESIIENLKEQGFRNIALSVNYKRDVIQNYFGNGSRHGVSILYLQEEKPLGTAGSLTLFQKVPQEPFLVMNADLITDIDFSALLAFHRKKKAMATLCIREYDLQIPYGVVKFNEKQRVLGLEEKPKLRYFVNAGIYVLDPGCLKYMTAGEPQDMTELLEKLLADKQMVAAFPMRENWLDIGKIEDFEKANRE